MRLQTLKKKKFAFQLISRWVSETVKTKESLEESIYLGNLSGEFERKTITKSIFKIADFL